MASAGVQAIRASQVLVFLAWASVAGAQGRVELRGRVLGAEGRPLPGASVTLTALGFAVRTDSVGAYVMTGTPGSTLSLTITAGGHRADTATVVLPRSGALTRDFTLQSNNDPLPEANPSERVLSGKVTDTEGTPLAYATVLLNGGRRYVTNDTGRFSIPIPIKGAFSLLVRRIGFKAEQVKLEAMPDTAVTIRLEAMAQALPETKVTATSPYLSLDVHGFYRRMKDVEKGINRGYFVTPEELELRKPTLTTTAVEHLPNVRVRVPVGRSYPSNPNRRPRIDQPVPRMWRQRIEDGKGCPMTVYLDRVRIQPMMIGGQLEDEPIDAFVQPQTVAAIEVYPSTLGSPPEFLLAPFTCGLVLLWTK